MGSVAAGLSSIGGSLAQAQDIRRQRQLQDLEAQRKQKEIDVQSKYADIAAGRTKLESQEFEERKRQANMPKLLHTYKGSDDRMHLVWQDPVTQRISDQALGTESTPLSDKIKTAEQTLGRALTDEEKRSLLGIKAENMRMLGVRGQVRDKNSGTGWSWPLMNESTGKVTLVPGAPNPYVSKTGGTGGSGDSMLEALSNKWANEGIKPPAKMQAAVEKYMEDHDIKAKVKLSATELKLHDLIKQVNPKITQLKKLIEDNKLEGENDWIFSDRSALMQHLRFFGYKRGVKPDKIGADLIKSAAALKVMGASPWIQLGRGKYMYETIAQHLPDPTDTPALLYDKLQFLQIVMDEAQASLPPETGQPESPDADAEAARKYMETTK